MFDTSPPCFANDVKKLQRGLLAGHHSTIKKGPNVSCQKRNFPQDQRTRGSSHITHFFGEKKNTISTVAACHSSPVTIGSNDGSCGGAVPPTTG